MKTKCLKSVFALFLLFASPMASAATITVDTTVDELTNNGKCSLREAIRSANIDMPFDTCTAGSGVDKIVLPKGTYILSLVSTNEDAAMDGDLDIVNPLVILGEGPGTSILGNGLVTQDRIFHVRPGGVLLLKDLGLFGGFHPSASGGGIYAEGPLGLLNCRVEGNIQGDPNQVGGAIAAKNVNVTIADTSILNNQALGSGGGIVLHGGQAVIKNSTIALNKAGKHVGGVAMVAGTLDLNNVTITANVADEDNTNDGDGGGLLSFGTVTIKNSIVSGNTDGSGQSHDCFGNVFSQGHNILGIKDGCAFSGLDGVDGDHVGTAASPKDTQLGPLAGNGGFTPTYSLLAGSPAIDGGNNGTCASSDQRGFARPEDGDGDGTATCDIGALEIGCGNGVVEVFETCDDGNSDDTDACPTTCEIADCGDGFVQAGVEACDDGNQDNSDSCTNVCALPSCGDGILQSGEACDDGNLTDGDGCSGVCLVEVPAADNPPADDDPSDDSLNDEPTDEAEGLPVEQPEGSAPGGGGCQLASGHEGGDPSLALWMIAVIGLLVRIRFSRRQGDGAVRRFIALTALISFLILGPTLGNEASAATIDVNTDKDEYAKDGDCSLREAIQAANKNMAVDACTAGDDINDTVHIPAGTYKIEIAPDGTPDDGEDGDFDVSASLAVQGSGVVVIDGNAIDRVFHVSKGDFTLSQVTIQNGKTAGDGGGIYRVGANDGLLKIVQSAIVNNEADYGGGLRTQSSLEMVNSTVSGNKAKGTGGLFLSVTGGSYSLNNVTVAFNKALGPGWVGGVYVGKGALKVANSIIALNEDPTVEGPDCDETFGGTHESLGYNIIGNTKGCDRTGQVDKDILNPVNFQLAALSLNGGTTLNHALQVGPAVDGGNPAGCVDQNGNPLNSDQRGMSRFGPCDIGAIEIGCGNGVVEVFETCDDGNSDDTDACPTTCEVADCGDGFVQAGVEGCDDGNATDGDGCNGLCAVEVPAADNPPADDDPSDDSVNDEPTDEAEGLPVEQPEGSAPGGGSAGGGCSLLPSRGLS